MGISEEAARWHSERGWCGSECRLHRRGWLAWLGRNHKAGVLDFGDCRGNGRHRGVQVGFGHGDGAGCVCVVVSEGK